MIDGVTIVCKGVDWSNQTNGAVFASLVDTSTGEVLHRHSKAKDNGLHLVKNGFTGSLRVNGSLPKYYNSGHDTTETATLENIKQSISQLSKKYAFAPENTIVYAVEFGVNVALPFPPQRVFEQAVTYKGRTFQQIDEKDKSFGLMCVLGEYIIKLYDKGKDTGQGGNVLRFEVKTRRMRFVAPANIKNATDLHATDKIAMLGKILLEVWSNILFFDASMNWRTMGATQQRQFFKYQNPNYWAGLPRRSYFDNRLKAETLLRDFSSSEIVPTATAEIQTKIAQFKPTFEAEKHGQFPTLKAENEAGKNRTFSHLEYVLPNVRVKGADFSENKNKDFSENTLEKKDIENSNKNLPILPIVKKCVFCNRDISNQWRGSRFCSKKYVGEKLAKRCRNGMSNARRDIKQFIKKYETMEKQTIFAVTYWVSGSSYTDLLGIDEMELTREFLDKITMLKVVKVGTINNQNQLKQWKRNKQAQ